VENWVQRFQSSGLKLQAGTPPPQEFTDGLNTFFVEFGLFRGEYEVERKKALKRTLSEQLQPKGEACMNPWNGGCGNTDIALYIFYGGRRLPICRGCWTEIASDNVEWRCD